MSFCRETERKARKQHECDLCGAVIQIGDTYIDHADNIIDSGTVYQGKECLSCQPIKKEFNKSSYSDEGYSDEYMMEWWKEVKCCQCENYAEDNCDDMTHYCRCENFKPIVVIEGR